ncbi:hypothetical protein BSK20_01535 [SR1 bacterium human oral taxon HOT-345]|jgi:hypothetical protein|nr:hypothetical protein BSK20_01535 [SR1 bacterium human oral taxon HOT-345]
MSLEQNLHKKMMKMILGTVVHIEDTEQSEAVLSAMEDTAKPKARGIKQFFLSGINELKRDIKKGKKKSA